MKIVTTNHVLILGGGASGVLLAVHLLRDRTAHLKVTIVEKRSELGAGAAYATNHPDHLLNVRANNMSAFPDHPGHFADWLRQAGATLHDYTDDTCFAPRHLYRDYLAGLLAPPLDDGRLVCRHAEAVAVHTEPHGVRVSLADGGQIEADRVVIATGNEGPALPPEPWRHDGWSDPAHCRVEADAPVVVVGTGLTMVDRVMALLHAGHRGPITAVSRHGFMPQSHKPVAPRCFDKAQIPFATSSRHLLRWLRGAASLAARSGEDWRGVVDGLRPHTQALWRHLPTGERRRFLRHARPFWDVHRHRIAPAAANRLADAIARGQLTIVAAHVVGFEPRPQGGVDVRVARRVTRAPAAIYAEAVFECRGRSQDLTRTENPVLRQLLRSGAARPDPLRLGLDVTQDCALIDAAGDVGGRLFGLGPVTAGIFWEVVAIPDIRGQAAQLAHHLASTVTHDAASLEACRPTVTSRQQINIDPH